MCWTKTRDRSVAIFNLHSSNLQHDMLQLQRVNTLNVLARCHFGVLNGTYTYMLFGQVEFNFAKASFNPIYFVKLKFSLANFCFKKNSFLPKFSPQVLTSEIGMRRFLNSFNIMSLRIVRNRGHG
jgi:hypothetical protein